MDAKKLIEICHEGQLHAHLLRSGKPICIYDHGEEAVVEVMVLEAVIPAMARWQSLELADWVAAQVGAFDEVIGSIHHEILNTLEELTLTTESINIPEEKMSKTITVPDFLKMCWNNKLSIYPLLDPGLWHYLQVLTAIGAEIRRRARQVVTTWNDRRPEWIQDALLDCLWKIGLLAGWAVNFTECEILETHEAPDVFVTCRQLFWNIGIQAGLTAVEKYSGRATPNYLALFRGLEDMDQSAVSRKEGTS